MSAIRISFSNKKGGVAKSTLSCLFASAMHYEYSNINVAILDIDPNQNIFTLRKTESSKVTGENGIELLKRVNEKLKTAEKDDIYDIISAPIANFDIIHWLNEFDGKYDYIILETPGKEEEKLKEVYLNMDFIFVPFNTSEFSITTTDKFLKELKAKFNMKGNSYLREVKLIKVMYPNKFSSDYNRVEEESFTNWENYFKEKYGYECFTEVLYYSPLFKGVKNPENSLKLDSYINTISPFPKGGEFDKISPYPLIEEIRTFINKSIS